MNELQVKTINLSPAIVEFNFDELSQILDSQLAKYNGLTFTEKEAADCKKTVTELNKGKKALDDYRKKTKKELTASITKFENKCKELSAKFDSVINPLKEQHDQFEGERKNLKRMQIEGIIDHLVHVENLNDKYAAQLVVEDKYLNKSTTIKAIQEELTGKAEHLGVQQDKEEANQEVIKSHVELINTRHGINLPVSVYLSLLDFKDVGTIKILIKADSEKEVENKKFKQVPLSSAPGHDDEKVYVEKYQIEGTESELCALEEFLETHSFTWKVIEE